MKKYNGTILKEISLSNADFRNEENRIFFNTSDMYAFKEAYEEDENAAFYLFSNEDPQEQELFFESKGYSTFVKDVNDFIDELKED